MWKDVISGLKVKSQVARGKNVTSGCKMAILNGERRLWKYVTSGMKMFSGGIITAGKHHIRFEKLSFRSEVIVDRQIELI